VTTRAPDFGKASSMRLRVLLFLVLWLAYGAAINSSNLLDFDLQQIGVEAMVERGHFYLEGSTSPQLQTKGDVFEYNGHKYAAKQPGQFMAGAVVYFLLNKLGLNYVNNYLLTSALVTFFTASLILAISGLALFGIARSMTADGQSLSHDTRADRGGGPLFWPLTATLSYTLATTALAYSGIAHHDALATGSLVIAVYLTLQLSREKTTTRASYWRAAGAGLLFGLTITTSMLPFFMVLLFVIYFLYLRRRSKLLPIFFLAMLTGLLPLFIYNAVSFGNPLLLPNVAGAALFADTFFHFDPNNFGDKLVFYARSVTAYAPVFVVGLFGWSYYPREIKRGPEFLTLVAAMVVLAAFVLNIRSNGDCQFGPRYLLPAMPFACLGIAGYSYLSTQSQRQIAGIAVLISGALSLVINFVGAVGGAMNCPDGRNAFRNQVAALLTKGSETYPLARWLIVPLVICLILVLFEIVTARKLRARSVDG
jgi:hypothetical protein